MKISVVNDGFGCQSLWFNTLPSWLFFTGVQQSYSETFSAEVAISPAAASVYKIQCCYRKCYVWGQEPRCKTCREWLTGVQTEEAGRGKWGRTKANSNFSSQTNSWNLLNDHKIDDIQPCKKIQGWIFPSGPTTAVSRQQMRDSDSPTSARHKTNSILLRRTYLPASEQASSTKPISERFNEVLC